MSDLIRKSDALAVVRPTGERPCDCRGCRGSLPTAEDWARWDAFSRAAASIEALPAVTVGVQEAVIHRAVLDWIKNDTGAAIKMTITPDQANAMTARILAALEPVAAPTPQQVVDTLKDAAAVAMTAREAALREAAAMFPDAGYTWCPSAIRDTILALIPKGADGG